MCTRSMGQRIRWELCARTLVFDISRQTLKDFESRKRLCCVSKQGRWECRSIERRNVSANLQVKGSSMLGGVRRISTSAPETQKKQKLSVGQ
jgi:hypothetical protein